MALQDTIGEYSFVYKIDVPDLELAARWYIEVLELVPDKQYDTPTWRQLNVPGISALSFGLNAGPPPSSSSTVGTFVVKEILAARNGLIKKDVKVGPVIDAGHGVYLVFFQDPFGNTLSLRQNTEGAKSADSGS